MTKKEMVLETIRALPHDCSLEEIAERIEFMAAVQKGLDQLDRGEGIPHDEVKRQADLMAYKLIRSPAAGENLHDMVVFIRSITAKEFVL
jgi:predicted transcriptional regulator